MKKRRPIQEIKQPAADMSVTVYDEARLREVEYDDQKAFKIVKEPVDIYNFNHKKPSIFLHPDSRRRPPKPQIEYRIGNREDVEGTVRWLAKAAVVGYGGFVAVVDTAKATSSERNVDLALERLQDLRKTDAFRILFSLQYCGEANLHIARLQEGISRLPIPYLPIIAMERPEEPQVPRDGTSLSIDIASTF